LQQKPFLLLSPHPLPSRNLVAPGVGGQDIHDTAFSQVGFNHSPCELLTTNRNLQLLHLLLILFQLHGSSTPVVSEEDTISWRDRQGNDWPLVRLAAAIVFLTCNSCKTSLFLR